MFCIEALLVYLNQDTVLYVSNATVEHESETEITPQELATLMTQQGFQFQDVLTYADGELTTCEGLQSIPLADKKNSLIVIFKKKSKRFTRKSKSRLNLSPLPDPLK